MDNLCDLLHRIQNRIKHEIDLRVTLPWMHKINKTKSSSIIRPGGPVVSLTSYGRRVESVYLTIESIGRGTVLPSRIILWLDDEDLLGRLPVELQRLQRRGLEIKTCPNLGPHKKYYPYVESLEEFVHPLVTADDDLLYPRHWLKRLVKALEKCPNVVNCHRARVIQLTDDHFAPYSTWEMAKSTAPSFRNFAIGVGGAIYPSSLQRVLKEQGTAFLNQCPRNDDIWLHVQAVRAGYRVRQIGKKAFRLVEIPGSQAVALHQENVSAGGNDAQIEATYQRWDHRRVTETDWLGETCDS